MLKLLGFIIILLLVILMVSFYNRFTLIHIEGESMSPTFKDGQWKMIDRQISPEYITDFGRKLVKGAILVYYSPQGRPVVKRLISKSVVSETETLLWFEGDNKENSKDSRDYGFVSQERVYGEVINFSTFVMRTFTFRKSGILKEENTL